MNPINMSATDEILIARSISEGRYYHGGRGGMAKGQFVLPPSITRARSLAKYGNHLTDMTQVYVTTNPVAALLYAVGVRNGDVYEVSPVGDLSVDPDCDFPGLSFSCQRARIVKVLRFTKAERENALRALLGSDMQGVA